MTVLTKMNLDGIAYELKPNCEITRYVVFLIYKDGGMKAVDAYISTFKPVDGRINRYRRLLYETYVRVNNWLRRAYMSFKLMVIKKAGI